MGGRLAGFWRHRAAEPATRLKGSATSNVPGGGEAPRNGRVGAKLGLMEQVDHDRGHPRSWTPSAPSTSNISVVIRTYTEERWDDLVSAVDSVQEQTDPPKEIVVVVDHEPRLVDRVADRFRDVVVVDNHQARGASG